MIKTLHTNIAVNDYMTLDCNRRTLFNVIQIIHRSVGMKCFFFSFTKMTYLL